MHGLCSVHIHRDIPVRVDMPLDRIERETMLLGRYMHLLTPRVEWRLDRSAYILLSRIEVEGPMSISQLSEAFGLDASTLNRQTAAMLRAGVVERIPDPDGGIARKFAITDEGARRLDSDRERNVAGLAKVMADWTPEEAEQLAASLSRLNLSIERLDGRPWPRD